MSEQVTKLINSATTNPEVQGLIRIKEMRMKIMKEIVTGLADEGQALLIFEELSDRPEKVYEIEAVQETGIQSSIEDTNDLDESASLKAISVCAGYVMGTQLQKQFRMTTLGNPKMSYDQMIKTLPDKFSFSVKREFTVYKMANRDTNESDADILTDVILHTAIKFYSNIFNLELSKLIGKSQTVPR